MIFQNKKILKIGLNFSKDIQNQLEIKQLKK